MDFHVIRECHRSLVVNTETGIVIVENEQPQAAFIECQELVLCPLVYHSEHQRGYVIKQEFLFIEVLFQFLLEFFGVVLARYHPFKYPLGLLYLLVPVRETCFQRVFPVREVCSFEKSKV